MARKAVVIRLELRLADNSLTGSARDGTGAKREFVGWLGLVTAIDALLPWSSPAPSATDSIGDPNERRSS